MRIGVMLRHFDQHGGGVRVYTRELLPEMLALDAPHEYVFMYADPKFVGTYQSFDNVKEVAVRARSMISWDQVAAPRLAKREGVDLIFNPKYSLSLFTDIPGVFVCHGLDWYVEPKWSSWPDRISHRLLVPLYARRAAGIIAVSDTTRRHTLKFFDVTVDEVRSVYLGVDERFRTRASADTLASVRSKYGLPNRYFLYCGQIYPPKNFARLLRAFARVGPANGVSLVVAGEHTAMCEAEVALVDDLDLAEWVLWSGWVDHDTLPAFYQMAEALVMPSLYEACPSPPLEAMASGCPVVTANRHGTKEIAGDAAVLVDPEDVDSIASGMRRILKDFEQRRTCVERGLVRSRAFSWKTCARETVAALEFFAAHGRRHRSRSPRVQHDGATVSSRDLQARERR